ncbi:MAG: DUF4384 domain-containing protein [Azospirillum sp.]|nr:DUF4384 domain-containing protein [Azospirillum sp.]
MLNGTFFQPAAARATGYAVRWLVTLCALTLPAAGWAAPASLSGDRGAIYALIVGVDDYQHVTKLQGAVNDARDIARALTAAGARDVRLLVDRAADRDAIIANWRALIAEAPPGSTLIFTYAGHGSQSAELVPGSESDGLDEFLVLPGFAASAPAVHQRLIDDDIFGLLREASGHNVIFVSDSCHSGTMTRGLDPRAERPSVRATAVGPLDPDPLIIPDPATAKGEVADLPNVTFFAAVADQEEAPEVSIDGAKRGALSWAFARAAEGAADANGDGVTTAEELERFIRENVRMKVRGLQHPQVTRGGPPDAVALPAGLAQAPTASPPAPVADVGLPLLVIDSPEADPASLAAALTGIRPASPDTPGRFTWDVARAELLDDVGDVVAEVRTGDLESELSRIQGALDKWAVVRRLETEAARRSLEIRLQPGDRRFREGEVVTLEVGGNRFPYFTLFNLAADGTINVLYPVASLNDSLTIPAGRPYTLTLKTTPPFGADHFIAIASERPLPGLHTALGELDGRQEAAQITVILEQNLKNTAYQLGIHGVFSGPD